MTTTQDNPGRPPKHWMRRCIKGVTAGKSAADPGAVCGSLWHHKLSGAQRREILKEERTMGGLVENPVENPMSTGGVLFVVGAVVAAGGLVYYLATREKKEEEKPATSFTKPGGGPLVPPPTPSAPCVVDAGNLHVFAQSRGMLAVYLPACPPATPPVQNQPAPPYTPCWDGPEPPTWAALWTTVLKTAAPTVPVLLALRDGSLWTYGGSPPTYSKRDDLRAEYCTFAAGQFTLLPITYQLKGDPASLFIL